MKTDAFSPSKLLTAVLSLMVSATGSVAWAEDDRDTKYEESTVKQYKEYKRDICPETPTALSCQSYEEFLKLQESSSGGTDDCRTSTKEMDTALTTFGGSDDDYKTVIACKTCNGRKKGSGSYCELPDRGDSKDRYNYASYLNRNKAADRRTSDAMKARIASCPILAAEKAEDLKDEIDKYKEKEENKQKEIDTLRQEMIEAQAAMEDAKTALTDKQDAAENKQNERIRKMKDGTSERIKRIDREYDGISQKISEMVQGVQQITFQRNNSYRTLQDECRVEARKRVNTYLEGRRAKLTANQLKANSLEDLFGRTGRSTEQKSQAMALEYYEECIAVNNNRKGSIDEDYEQRIKAMNGNVSSLRQTQMKLIQEDPDLTRAQREELNQIYKDYQKEVTGAQTEYTKLVEKQGQLLMEKQKQLSQMEMDIDEIKDLVSDRMSVAKLADSAGDPKFAEGDIGNETNANFTKVAATSRAALSACCTSPGALTAVSSSGRIEGAPSDTPKTDGKDCPRIMEAVCKTSTSSTDDKCTKPELRLIDTMKRRSKK